jgi:hypothetical protein
MATEIIMRGVPGGFIPCDPFQADQVEQFRGKEVMVKISVPRNLKFHKKFFALLGAARECSDTEFNAEQFRAYVICGSGWCDFIPGPDGVLIAFAKSISFAKMDDGEFERLYKGVLDFVFLNMAVSESDINRLLEFA